MMKKKILTTLLIFSLGLGNISHTMDRPSKKTKKSSRSLPKQIAIFGSLAAVSAGAFTLMAKAYKAYSEMSKWDIAPLHYATLKNSTLFAKILIPFYSKEEINRVDKFSETPLFFAVKHNNYEVVKLLLEQGLDPNIKCASHLLRALRNKNLKMLHLLLKHGANPNVNMNPPLLQRAVRNNDITLANLALEHKADPNNTFKLEGILHPSHVQNGTALYYAIKNKNHAMIDLLLYHNAKLTHDEQNELALGLNPTSTNDDGGHIGIMAKLLPVD